MVEDVYTMLSPLGSIVELIVGIFGVSREVVAGTWQTTALMGLILTPALSAE